MIDDEPLLSMTQVADRAGLTLSRVRYYERAGLLPPPECAGRQRRYGASVLDALRAIGEAQEAGLSLNEIHELTELRCLATDGRARR
jgi:MerR family redox-sensitive transcriptional activator SoxR